MSRDGAVGAAEVGRNYIFGGCERCSRGRGAREGLGVGGERGGRIGIGDGDD